MRPHISTENRGSHADGDRNEHNEFPPCHLFALGCRHHYSAR
jgi:hypothetical protein